MCKDKDNGHPRKKPTPETHFLQSPHNILVIFTILSILGRMRRSLGLEAMLDYQDEYVIRVAEANPEMAEAVYQALSVMNVERIYREMLGD